MGYMKIPNLYKDDTVLMFKQVYCLEKVHGTSCHVSKSADGQFRYYSGGLKQDTFEACFDKPRLEQRLAEQFPDCEIIVYGEGYGGKCQKMSDTYGKDTRFIVFDVKINGTWLNVQNAHDVATKLGLEFVPFVRAGADLCNLQRIRDLSSDVAALRGMGSDKQREGIVIRPLTECRKSNGERVIAKYKTENFRETATPREVSSDELKVLEDAKAIADEWVTEMRLTHVLDKFPNPSLKDTGKIINAMINDVITEAGDEIVVSRAAKKAIGRRAALLFKRRIVSIVNPL